MCGVHNGFYTANMNHEGDFVVGRMLHVVSVSHVFKDIESNVSASITNINRPVECAEKPPLPN